MTSQHEQAEDLGVGTWEQSSHARVLDDHYVIAGNWALPRRYEVVTNSKLNDEVQPSIRLEVAVDDGGRLRCESLTIRVAPGESLRTEQIRVPLERLLHDSTSAVFEPAVCVGPDGKLQALATMTMEDIANMKRDLRRPARTSRGPGSRVSDGELREVTEIYRAACTSGRPPVNAVADQMVVSRATAGRRIQEARRRGFLGPAVGTRAGEASAGS